MNTIHTNEIVNNIMELWSIFQTCILYKLYYSNLLTVSPTKNIVEMQLFG